MRFRTLSLVCSALIVLSADVVTAQNAPSLDGRWEGMLAEQRARRSRELRQPRQVPVVALISTAGDGKYSGKWLITSAGRIADIGEVAVDDGTIRIAVPSSGVWEGTLSSDGLTLMGEWRQDGDTSQLVLRRTGNADDPVTFSSFKPGTVSRR